MVNFEKKEPSFKNEKKLEKADVVKEKKVKKSKVSLKTKIKSMPVVAKTKKAVSKVKSKVSNLNHKQKKSVKAGVISIVVLLGLYGIISLFTDNAGNIDTGMKKVVETKEVKEVEKVEVVAPSFDTSLLNPKDRNPLVSGRANPNDKVYIMADGKLFDSVKADDNGQWVMLTEKKLKYGDRKLSLYIIDDNGKKIWSEQTIIFHVSKPKDKKDKTFAVLVGGGKKSKVLQAPKGQNIGGLRIAKIDYNEDGDISVAGYAKKSAKVYIYVNGEILSKEKANRSGKFESDFDIDIKEGKEYKVSADMLNSDGKVVKRVSYKFTPRFHDGKGSAYVVKKGDNLWNISFNEYEKGTSYVVIFEANKKNIESPNLIFPGQVLNMPKKESKDYEGLRKKYYKKED